MANSVPNYPGSAEIVSVYHDNGTQQNDITLFAGRIDIYSDVNIGPSTCILQIVDFENFMFYSLLSTGDVVGFIIKENEQEYERRYKIGKIGEIVNLENGKAFQLQLVSELAYASYHIKLSKYVTGNTSEIALGLLNAHTHEAGALWETSASGVDFIIPQWSPIKAIKWLAKKSRSNLSPSRFMFFQDSKQFWNFTSLKNIDTLENNPITLRYYQNTLSDKDGIPNTQAIMTTIQDLKFLDSFDVKKELDRGHLKTTDYTYDITTKTIEVSQNSFFDTYAANILNPKMSWKPEEFGSGNITFSTRQSLSTPNFQYATPNDEISETFTYGKSQQIEINLYGNNIIDIGQVVNIEIPSMEPHKGETGIVLDKLWSGKYYVTSKHDAYDKSGHTMALRLAKDSFI